MKTNRINRNNASNASDKHQHFLIEILKVPQQT